MQINNNDKHKQRRRLAVPTAKPNSAKDYKTKPFMQIEACTNIKINGSRLFKVNIEFEIECKKYFMLNVTELVRV